MLAKPNQRILFCLSSDALKRVWILGLLFAAYSVPAAVWPDLIDVGLPVEAALTFAIGIMLALRLGRAYERWWEGRKQWGALVNASRNLAVKARELGDPDPEEQAELRRLICGFALALADHLRDGVRLRDVRGFGSEEADPRHVPSWISGRIYGLLEAWRREGRLADGNLNYLDREARVLLEVCGACERIRTTPMSPSFPAFLRLGILVLLLSYPWELADRIGWLTVPAMVLVTFFFAGGESIAVATERPFERHTDGLDLESYCAAISESVGEILGVDEAVMSKG